MRYKTSSWKRKVDPAFDVIIKLALELLDAVKLPGNEGYIHLTKEDPLCKIIQAEGFPDFKNFYENIDPANDINNWEKMLSGVKGGKKPSIFIKKLYQDFSAVLTGITLGQMEVVDNILQKLISSLAPESKEYYMTVFTFSPAVKPDTRTMSQQEQIELFIYQLSNVFSLFMHKAFIGIQNHRDIVKELNAEFIKMVLFQTWNVISLIVNEKSLRTLYVEAKAGDTKPLFKIMRIDKTLFDHDWVRERIREAMYSGDRIFFKALSKAMSDDPLKNRKIRTREFIVLIVFWEVGLYRLSISELLKLFNDCGLALRDDEVTFRKFVDRAKKVKPQVSILSYLFHK
ncbi:MAG: hypothetical protein C0402_01500 [Thermodesulfovibrio sp.]|nr:hypothetical protein [Thermodesulfovibrio sp.]